MQKTALHWHQSWLAPNNTPIDRLQPVSIHKIGRKKHENEPDEPSTTSVARTTHAEAATTRKIVASTAPGTTENPLILTMCFRRPLYNVMN